MIKYSTNRKNNLLTSGFVWIIMLCWGFPTALYAQASDGYIIGSVLDVARNPLSAVSINQANKTHAITDSSGSYRISLPAGRHTLTWSSIGYQSQQKVVEVIAEQKLQVEDVILIADSRQLAESIVNQKTKARSLKEQAFNVDIIDAKVLYNSAADLNQVLNQTAGVRIREDGGVGSNFSFSLNGFSGRQVKFFLDGIPMDNFGSSLSLNNFPTNMAERLEVYKGVLPIHLGADALGGAINIVTRQNLNFLDISYGFGSYNTHKASVNHAYTNQKTGFTVRTNAFYNYSDNNYKVTVNPIYLSGDLQGQRMGEQEVERFHDGYQSATVQIEAGLTGKSYADQLLFGIIASGNTKDIQTGVTMDQVFGARTSNSSSIIPTIKYKKTDLLVSGLDFSLYSAYNMGKNNFIDTTRIQYNWLQETIANSTAELNRSQLINKDNEALVTANLTYAITQQQALSFNYVVNNFRRHSSDEENPNNPTFEYPQKLNKQVLGLAWQHETARLNLTAFTKLYVLNVHSYEQATQGSTPATYKAITQKTNNLGYGAAAAYFVLPKLQAKASFEHTYRLPEAIELLGDGLYTRRNSALKPESSNNLNIGALFQFGFANPLNQFALEANYIFRSAHNYIRLDQAQVKPVDRQYINIGDVTTNGVEGSIRYSWDERLQLGFNLTYQQIIDKEEFLSSTNLTGTTTSPNLGYGYRIPNMPYLFGNADISYQFKSVGRHDNNLALNYSLNFVEKYYLTPSHLGENNTDLIPQQIAHNLLATYVLGKGKYNISLEGRNLTNNKLFDNYKLQKPGRSVFLKLRYFLHH